MVAAVAVACAAGLGCGGTASAAPNPPRFSIIHAFGDAPGDGWQPWGSPTLVGSTLWGRTTYGGSNNQGGVIWRLDPQNPRSYKVAHAFGGSKVQYPRGRTGPDVANPHHDWMRALADGTTLVGAGLYGGRTNQGGVFAFNAAKKIRYRVLHSFNGISPANPNGSAKDGAQPHSNPVPVTDLRSRKILVGMTAYGGANGTGSLYKMNSDGSGFKVLYSFIAVNGDTPHGFVIQRGQRLFGMTRYGGITAPRSNFASKSDHKPYESGNGSVFSFNLKTGKLRVLHLFSYQGPAVPTLVNGGYDGAVPDHGGLTYSNGRLYGLTTVGGANGSGVLFSININGSGYRIEHTFGTAMDLAQPHGTLMAGPDGIFYALAATGGTPGSGGVFRFNPKNGKYQVLHSFGGGATGINGEDNPVVTTNAKGAIVLYGMTQLGGPTVSNINPTPIAPDYSPKAEAQANGTIWKLVLAAKK